MPKKKTYDQISKEITEEQIDKILKKGICPYHEKQLEYKAPVRMDQCLGSDKPTTIAFGQLESFTCPERDIGIYAVWTNVHGRIILTQLEYTKMWAGFGMRGVLKIDEQKRDPRETVKETLAYLLAWQQYGLNPLDLIV